MFTKENKIKLKELKELNYHQKELYSQYIKQNKIPSIYKKSLKNLINSTNSIDNLKIIDINKHVILSNIYHIEEEHSSKRKLEQSKETFFNILDTIKYIINDKDKRFLLNYNNRNYNMFNSLNYVEEINSYIEKETLNKLLNRINTSKDETELKLYTYILNNSYAISDSVLIKVLVDFIDNNSDKLKKEKNKIILKIFDDLRYAEFNDNIKNGFNLFYKSIRDCNDKNILNHISNLANNYYYKNYYKQNNNEVLKDYLFIIENKSDNKHLTTIISLLNNETFFYLEDKNLRTNIINRIINLEESNLTSSNIVRYVNTVLEYMKNSAIRYYLINKISDMKEDKTLSMLIDLCPFLSKYCLDDNDIKENIKNIEKYTKENNRELKLTINTKEEK